MAPADSAGTPRDPSPALLCEALLFLPSRSPLAALPSDSVSLSPALSLRRLLPLGLFILPSASSSWARALSASEQEKRSEKQFLPRWGLTPSLRSVLCPLPLHPCHRSPPPAIVPLSGEYTAQTCESPPPLYAPAGPRTEVAEFPQPTSLERPSGSGGRGGGGSGLEDPGAPNCPEFPA